MSLAAIRWARGQTAGDQVAKAALMALAERADPRSYCHPSLATLAADMECDRATAKRAVRRLVERGLVELVTRFEDTSAGQRRQTSNRYRLLVTQGQSDPGSNGPPGQSAPGAERPGGQSAPPPGAERPSPPGQSAPPGTSHSEPVNEPSSSVCGDSKSEPATSSDDDGLSSDLVEAVVALKIAGRSIDNPARYRATVARSVCGEHGDELRQVRADHPEWPAQWVAAHVLGLPLTDPSPAEVIDACPDCTNGMVETAAGADWCGTCRWARAA